MNALEKYFPIESEENKRIIFENPDGSLVEC